MKPDAPLPLALDLLPAEWAAVMGELGQPAYRARQVFHALHAAGVRDWAAVRTLPAALREQLAGKYVLAPSAVVQRAQSRDGTAKYLLGLRDGREVETVHIPDDGRVTVCVSSQAGCALACTFCATGRLGLLRNLAAGEIVDQVERAREGDAAPNVVFMGMGEPLASYAAVVRAIRLLLATEGLGLSPRRITLSTSGLPDRMRQLARENLGIRLAVSLHAADDAKRTALMPINARYPIAAVLAAAREYAERSGRRVSFEYVMLAGVNDTDADAARLAALLPRRLAHVNLIPYNPTDAAFRGSSPERIARFAALLRERGVACSVRRSRGRDVQAACGQLAGQSGREATGHARDARRIPLGGQNPRASVESPSGARRRPGSSSRGPRRHPEPVGVR
ncbi:MAG TPA: 23S rRNA (adenine(2503)-C(2))-methyltransferase RlmN [Chloroflexota bacterium]|jgi:23S rRNA (adenine2503-C2)-methyltransferase